MFSSLFPSDSLGKIIEQYKLFLQVNPGPWEWEAADESECSLHQVGRPYEDCILACRRCGSCSKQENGPLCGWPDENHSKFIANSWSVFDIFVKQSGNSLQNHLILSNEYYKIVKPTHGLFEIPFIDILSYKDNFAKYKLESITEFKDDCFYSAEQMAIYTMGEIFRLNWFPTKEDIHYRINKHTLKLSGPFAVVDYNNNDNFFFPSPEIAKLAFNLHNEQMQKLF